MSEKHVPEPILRDIVRFLAGSGYRDVHIANALNVHHSTLHRHYKDELNAGRDQLGCMCTKVLAEVILNPKHPKRADMALKLMQTFFKEWRPTSVTEITGKDGKPILDMCILNTTKEK